MQNKRKKIDIERERWKVKLREIRGGGGGRSTKVQNKMKKLTEREMTDEFGRDK